MDIENKYYLSNIKNLTSAEIFSDYLDMANYCLDEIYHIPAAELDGSNLEEHLRNRCHKNRIALTTINLKGKVHNKIDFELNTNLYQAELYNKCT